MSMLQKKKHQLPDLLANHPQSFHEASRHRVLMQFDKFNQQAQPSANACISLSATINHESPSKCGTQFIKILATTRPSNGATTHKTLLILSIDLKKS